MSAIKIHHPVSGNPLPHFDDEQVTAITRLCDELLAEPGEGPTLSALVGAGMGSGKTVIVSEVILAVREYVAQQYGSSRVLIIGPRDVYAQWFDTIEAQSDGLVSREGGHLKRIGTGEAGHAVLQELLDGEKPGIYYIGLELLRARGIEGQFAMMPAVDLIVTDEAHRHSNRATAGMKVMRTIPATRKIALSGTFFGNKFENAHTITRWLWPEVRREDGYWLIEPHPKMWAATWASVEIARSKSGRIVRNPRNRQPLSKINGEKKPGAFVQILPCYVYLASPLGDPPPSHRIEVPMTGDQERQYREMERQSLAWLVSETGTLEPLVADLPIIQRMRLRTAALGEMRLLPGDSLESADSIEFPDDGRSNKLRALGNLLLKNPDWTGERALILTHSKRFADKVARQIEERFPGQVAQKHGQTKERDWHAIKTRFMSPLRHDGTDLLYLVATHSAVGTGTDGLQHFCSREVILSRSENNTENMQSRQRIWRRGVNLDQYHSVEFITQGSIDEEVEERTDTHREQTLASIRGGYS